jgi:prephenate dehydratase
MNKKPQIIAFQGEVGAYSDLSCRTVYPDLQTLPCTSFDEAFEAVENGKADLAMIPIDNTIAGRVADVHRLIPTHDLFVIGEHFLPVHHNLLGVKGSKISDLKHVHSHIHALPQCRNIIGQLGLKTHVHADTAGAAAEIARQNDKAHAAIASSLAAEIYGLEILQDNIQDTEENITRFLILSTEPEMPPQSETTISSLLFNVRNIPAALYKALGGFATNGLSLTKLESYVDKGFDVAQFYCEVLGHPELQNFQLALEELGFYANDVKFLGAYPAHKQRNL